MPSSVLIRTITGFHWVDGVAPIGSFPPNPFGLHDMDGNLSEWCQEALGTYLVPAEEGDGERYMRGGSKIVRGGNYLLGAEDARCARRMEIRNAEGQVGLRPARSIDPRVDFVEEGEEEE